MTAAAYRARARSERGAAELAEEEAALGRRSADHYDAIADFLDLAERVKANPAPLVGIIPGRTSKPPKPSPPAEDFGAIWRTP